MEPYALHKQLEQQGVVLSFQGTVTPQVTTGTLEAVERYLDARSVASRARRKVCNVLVECLHNLFHHPLPQRWADNGVPLPERSSVLMVSAKEHCFEICAGNYVTNEKVPMLEERLSAVNRCDSDDLRELYRSVLANDERTERGGGGLGFIDIVRKSGSPVTFRFHPVDAHLSFFTYTARISL